MAEDNNRTVILALAVLGFGAVALYYFIKVRGETQEYTATINSASVSL